MSFLYLFGGVILSGGTLHEEGTRNTSPCSGEIRISRVLGENVGASVGHRGSLVRMLSGVGHCGVRNTTATPAAATATGR